VPFTAGIVRAFAFSSGGYIFIHTGVAIPVGVAVLYGHTVRSAKRPISREGAVRIVQNDIMCAPAQRAKGTDRL